MKTLKCDLCDVTAEGETFEAWMEALKPHYMMAHAEFMNEKMNMPLEEQQAEMKKWMVKMKKEFDNAG